MRLSHALAFMVLLLSAPHAGGQQSMPERPIADSSAVRLIAPGVIRALSGEIARALLDSKSKPWTIEIPDSASLVWRKFASDLSALLRTRTATSQDTVRHLTIRPIRLVRDTLVAAFEYRVTYPCTEDGQLSSEFVSYSFAIGRAGTLWDYPRSRPLLQGHGRCLPPA